MIARILVGLLGLAIGMLGPRHPRLAFSVFASLLLSFVGVLALAFIGAPILAAAFSFAALVAFAIALTRLSLHVVLFMALFLVLPIGAVTLIGDAMPSHVLARVAFGIALLALAVVLTIRRPLGVRVATALAASMLLSGFGPFVQARWAFALSAITLFALSGLTARDAPPPEWRALRAPIAVAAALVALAVLAPACLAPLLATPNAERLARLQLQAPDGGILWPLPSESVTWEGTVEPAVSNLDALYLGGSPAAFPVLVPGTSLSGRFALNGPVHDLRIIKEPGEVERLRQASQATVRALLDSLPLFHAGATEAAIAEAIQQGYRRYGCSGESFPPIVAAGRNALNPHYFANASTLAAGDVVVVDIGCYADHYASDFTRTIPVGGTFTPRARALYTALVSAQRTAEQACRPGAYLYGRKQLGGVDTAALTVEAMLRASTGQERMPHGLGHPIGLFVHDVFEWSKPLRAGMVVMLEPGVYLPGEGIGLRLEDAYHVTPGGCESLTTGFDQGTDSVERLTTAALAGSR